MARGASTSSTQRELFAAAPRGLVFREDFVNDQEQVELVSAAEKLSFKPFEFHGWTGNRETVSFGWRYDFNHARVEPAEPIPGFLMPLRERAAALAGIDPGAFEQALVIRYDVGAGIGWHRDRPVFEKVFGLSLLSPCVLRFRRRYAGGFERFSLDAPPRSAYLLTGEIRHDWEHSIAPMELKRYSITFRSRRP
jgi:alkylated DNA repair protein (DNA oxidative demethylase)